MDVFLDSKNHQWIRKHSVKMIYIPVIIVVFTLGIGIFDSISTALFAANLASAFHVVNQSIGINKLFIPSRGHVLLNLCTFIISFGSLYFLGIGFFRFYSPWPLPEVLMELLCLGIIILPILCLGGLYWKQRQNPLPIKCFLSTASGMMVYSPYAIVDVKEHAIAMGVGMHYCQYLALVIPIYLRKSKILQLQGESGNLVSTIARTFLVFGMFLMIYAATMVSFRQWDKGFETWDFSVLILIPLVFQMLHYYYESFIWRFSNSHIRKEVGSYVYAK
jgi:hypothetical protein